MRDVSRRRPRRLAAGGLVVLERATRREPDVPLRSSRVRDVKSGDSTLTFFRIATDWRRRDSEADPITDHSDECPPGRPAAGSRSFPGRSIR